MTKPSERNKHGLSRYIPREVRHYVRQYCGFGCVVCGNAYCEYHHFDPPFEDARQHDPKRIMLLCGTHHDRQKKGVLSDVTLRELYQNPKCRSDGVAHGDLDIGRSELEIAVGPMVFRNPRQIVRVFDEDVLAILPPEAPGAPFRITAQIYDRNDEPIFVMEDNVWEAGTSAWDIEIKGKRIIVRLGDREILFRLRQEPPVRFVIEAMNMIHRGVHISANEGQLKVILPDGRGFEGGEGKFINCEAAFWVSEKDLTIGLNHDEVHLSEFKMMT